MAKSSAEYEADLLASKNNQPALSDLDSNSAVSVWKSLVYVTSNGLGLLSEALDYFKAEVLGVIETKQWGTTRFLQSECFRYQHGDAEVWNGKQYAYPVLDPAKQIVEYASVPPVTADGQFLVKVALANRAVLSQAQKDGLQSFLALNYMPGADIVVISDDPDDLKLDIAIYVDPLMISATGESLASPGTFPFVDAINDFCANLPWDGLSKLSALEDAIQAVPGYVDHVLNSSEAKYQNVEWKPFNRVYNPFSGHLKLDEANSEVSYVQA